MTATKDTKFASVRTIPPPFSMHGRHESCRNEDRSLETNRFTYLLFKPMALKPMDLFNPMDLFFKPMGLFFKPIDLSFQSMVLF